MLRSVLVVFALCACVSVCFGLLTYPITSSEVYRSPHNWRLTDAGSIVTTNPGAYIKFGFTGGSLVINIDTTSTPQNEYQVVRYIIDGDTGAEVVGDITLPAADLGNHLVLPINVPAHHTVHFYLRSSMQSIDRWITPTNQLQIVSISVDDDAVLSRPYLRPSTLLVYWDSIGEGVLTEGRSGTDLTDNDATHTWAFTLAESLNSELSVVAYGRQGYAIMGNGNVAMLVNDTDEFGHQSAWSRYDATYSRLNAQGQIQFADYIFCGHATNDRGTPPAVLYATVMEFVKGIRRASPLSLFFLTVPFGGFNRPVLTQVFDDYTKSAPSDDGIALIDLGPEAAYGLNATGAIPGYSYDGLHPTANRSQELGYLLGEAAYKFLNQTNRVSSYRKEHAVQVV